MTYSNNQKLTTEEAEFIDSMSKERDNYEEYRERGQQNDYFDADISVAGDNAEEDSEE